VFGKGHFLLHEGGKRSGFVLGIGRLVLGGVVHVVLGLLEFLDAFAEALHDFGDFIGAEDDDDDQENDYQFLRAGHHGFPPSIRFVEKIINWMGRGNTFRKRKGLKLFIFMDGRVLPYKGDKPMTTLTISLSEKMKSEIGKIARKNRLRKSAVVRSAIGRLIARQQFQTIREELVREAQKKGVYTDEEIFKLVS
jgi:predicted transcriptional regulator